MTRVPLPAFVVIWAGRILAAQEGPGYLQDFEDGRIDPPLTAANYLQEEHGTYSDRGELEVDAMDGRLSIHGTGKIDILSVEGHNVGWLGRSAYVPIAPAAGLIAVEANVEVRTAILSDRGGTDAGYMAGLCLEASPGNRVNFFIAENRHEGPVTQVVRDEDGIFNLDYGSSFSAARGRGYRIRLELDMGTGVVRGLIGGVVIVQSLYRGDVHIARAGVMAAVRTDGDVLDARFDRLTVSTPAVGPFQRGDVNGDGAFDISDPIAVLQCKFSDGPCPRCLDSGDANDDGKMDISDALYLFNWRFLGGPSPTAPFPGCGLDATPDDPLGCSFASC